MHHGLQQYQEKNPERENRKYYLKTKKSKRSKVKGQDYGSDQNQNNLLEFD